MAEREHRRWRGAWMRAVARRMKAWADSVLAEEQRELEREASRVRSLPVREEPPAPPAPSSPGTLSGPPEHWLRDIQSRRSGPPSDWLERVKKGAPQLLDGQPRPGLVLRAPFPTHRTPSGNDENPRPPSPLPEEREQEAPPLGSFDLLRAFPPLPPGEGRGEGSTSRARPPPRPTARPPSLRRASDTPPEEVATLVPPDTLWGFDLADLQPPPPPAAPPSFPTAPEGSPPLGPRLGTASDAPERPEPHDVIPFPRLRPESPRDTEPLRRSWPPLPRPEEGHWSLFSSYPGPPESPPAPDAPAPRASMELADNLLFLEPPGVPRPRPPSGLPALPEASSVTPPRSEALPESALPHALPHPWPELPPAHDDDEVDVAAELRLRERRERLEREQRGE